MSRPRGRKSGGDGEHIRCRPAAVEKHLHQLSKIFSERSVAAVAVRTRARNDTWKKRPPGGAEEFEAWQDDGTYLFAGVPRREQAALIEIPPADGDPSEEIDRPANWFSYREVWRRLDSVHWSMQEAGFTFYCGRRGEGPNMTFRAEWAQPGVGSVHAANPHWHAGEGELVDTAMIHLGMAGWEHSRAAPACWQQFAVDPKEIRLWAKQTLEYMRTQFSRHPLQFKF